MLGVAMTPARRKKLLRVLSMLQDVQDTLRQTPVTEAALRAIATLDEDNQRQVAAAIADDPALAPRARRIARVLREDNYTLDEALAEARGEILTDTDDGIDHEPQYSGDQAIIDAVMAVLDASNALMSALDDLRALAPDPLDIPDPWRMYYQNALANLREEIG